VVDSVELDMALSGRDEVAATLFRSRGAQLIGLARTLVDTREEAEEVVQEAFTRLVAAFGRFDEDRADRYLTVTVLNLARSRLRRRRTARTYVERASPPADIGDGTELDAAARVVRSRVAQLPARQQACIVLRYFADRPDEDIARVLGISVGSVKTHLSRARAALAAGLEDERGR
jgi:RNA polymerase sigma-70 factor (sigma-E family)